VVSIPSCATRMQYSVVCGSHFQIRNHFPETSKLLVDNLADGVLFLGTSTAFTSPRSLQGSLVHESKFHKRESTPDTRIPLAIE
jgi:hypothetical protein